MMTKDDDVETFGATLTFLRLFNGFTQTELAEKTGIARTYLSGIESGRRRPPKNELIDKISNVLFLSDIQRWQLYDLSAAERHTVSEDLVDWVNSFDMYEKRRQTRIKLKGNNDD